MESIYEQGSAAQLAALRKLRAKFPEELISKLPRPTCGKEEYKDLPKGKCKICGGWHATSKTIHLDYVGHAALTDRLLDVDPLWKWEPFALDPITHLPLFDASGGLWIKLTICGLTRPGYGHAKTNPWADIGSREKEIIGDSIRNGAMRFGAALDLWHKGDLPAHAEIEEIEEIKEKENAPSTVTVDKIIDGVDYFVNKTPAALESWLVSKKLIIDGFSLPDQKKLNSYVIQVKAAMEPEQPSQEPPQNGAPELIFCPSGNIRLPKNDCSKCPDKAKCPAWASKLNINI